MKRAILPGLLSLLPIWLFSQTPPHCGADLFREMYAREYPELAQGSENLSNNFHLQPRTLITIPVVVHVVYLTEQQNISQEQIESQILVLNADYRAENDNLNIVPPVFQNLIADTEIEFCLASRDPEGHSTIGITRNQTVKDNIGLSTDVHYLAKDGADAWDPLHYLNIWVADMGENVVGRASFPGTVPLPEDGVVIDPRYFGTTGLASGSAPYNLGRTTVHEVGHYLNLYHPWGSDFPSCEGDDEVADTPQTSESYLQECPSTLQATCGSLDMYTNYMYYTDDACLAQFTPGQKLRMQATLSGPRSELSTSMGCESSGTGNMPTTLVGFSIEPNPSPGDLVFECLGQEGLNCQLAIFDAMGSLLQKLEIPANHPYPWAVPASFADGVYWVRVEQGGGVITRKWAMIR